MSNTLVFMKYKLTLTLKLEERQLMDGKLFTQNYKFLKHINFLNNQHNNV